MTLHHDNNAPSGPLLEAIRQALQDSPGRCPDLRRLAADTPEHWAVASHVAECPRCSAIVTAASTPNVAPPPPARWEALQNRAKALFEEPTDSIIRIVVQSMVTTIKRSLEVVEVLGDVVEPVPIRNDERDGLVVRRTFGEHDLTAHLAAEASGRFTLMVDVWSGGEPSDQVRVTLLRDRRELESMLPRQGRVLFGAVSPGTYRVSVATPRERIGAIDITFREAA